jgi:nitrous oxidase accessory protein NosD
MLITTIGYRTLIILSVILLATAHSVSAQAIALRVAYVTANGGSDTNPCTRSAPCRQVQRGVTRATSGGTVVILDSGEYENFTITKSVSVIADKGISAVIGNSGAYAGATISDGTAPYTQVTLRGLSFVDSDNGIIVDSQIDALAVEDCTIRAPLYGIFARGAGRYVIKNTQVKHSNYGIWFTTTGQITATVDDSRFEYIGTVGVTVQDNSRVTVRNTVSANNITGFWASNGGKMVLENCSATNNSSDGVIAEQTGYISVSNSTIAHNGIGFKNSGGTLRSFGNNRFSNNSPNLSGMISLVNQQ